MSVRNHAEQAAGRVKATIPGSTGRPPFLGCPPSALCEMVLVFEDHERPCRARSMWLLPEMRRCGHHVPGTLIPLLQARMRAWETFGAVAWLEVMAAHPIPEEAP